MITEQASTARGGELENTVAVERIVVPVWAWMIAAFAIMALYALTMENGAVLAQGATNLHEFVHDARHFVGVPCH